MHALKKASWIYLTGSVFVLAFKFGSYFLTGSSAILSDALESWVNILAAVVSIFLLKIVSQPADTEHPYGHGKLEYFSATIEGGLISFASLLILYQAVMGLLHPKGLQELGLGAFILVVASALNWLLAFYLKKKSVELNSESLKASSTHLMTDVWTSAVVVGGLGLVMLTQIWWLDSVLAFLLAGKLIYDGYQIIRKSVAGLIDQVQPEDIEKFAQAFLASRGPEFIDIHQLRMIRSGSHHHIDAHLVVPEYWNVAEAHEAMEQLESKIIAKYPYDSEIAFHLDPCAKKYCASCAVENCSIRSEPFVKLRVINFQTLTGAPIA